MSGVVQVSLMTLFAMLLVKYCSSSAIRLCFLSFHCNVLRHEGRWLEVCGFLVVEVVRLFLLGELHV